MNILVALFFISSILFAKDLSYKGNIGFETQYLKHDDNKKRDNALALRLELELKKEIEDSQIAIKLKAIYDKDDRNRRYIDFSDLYYRYNFEDSDILIGKSTRFWGALEFYNITDVFNAKDLLDDPFDYSSKLGALNIAYTKYIGSGEVSFITKLYEENQQVQSKKSINNFFPLPYDDNLQTQYSKSRPTFYLKYSDSLEIVQIDYGLIFQNGYDSQRYMSINRQKLVQNAYIVNKLLGYGTYIGGDTIYKTELVYAKSKDSKVSNYSEVAVGVEHTLYSLWDKKDLGLLVEYYRYNKEDNDKVEFNKIFANDLVVGFRLSLNDTSSSQVLGGVDMDLKIQEKIFFIEYDTRVWQNYKLKTSYRHLNSDDESDFKKLDSYKLEFGYYF